MLGSNTTKPYIPKDIVSVRPTRDGKWEVVTTTHEEDRKWKRDWNTWWDLEGKTLQAKHPEWWPKH